MVKGQTYFCIAALIICLMGLPSCSSVSSLLGEFKTYSDLKSVTIIRDGDANNNQYVLVDIALIYSDLVNELILPQDANYWFSQKDTYLSMSKDIIEVVAHQPIPLGLINKVKLPKNTAKAKRVIAYVAYYGKNAFFQFDLTHLSHVEIHIADKKPAVIEI